MSGRAAFLALLADERVTHFFGNPGTTELPIMEVMPDFPQLRYVLGLHEGVVVEEALTSALSLPGFLPLRDPKGYFGLASGGLGFALPGAIGVSLALPDRPVAALVGDGSAMYGVQAMWTAAHLKLPITYAIANNRGYRILKDRLVSMRGRSDFVGMDLRDPPLDFLQLAQGYGLDARKVSEPSEIGPVLREVFTCGRPNLVDIRVADGFGS